MIAQDAAVTAASIVRMMKSEVNSDCEKPFALYPTAYRGEEDFTSALLLQRSFAEARMHYIISSHSTQSRTVWLQGISTASLIGV